jgi:hypothetical protein
MEAETEENGDLNHYFRYYDQKNREYFGLFVVYKKKNGFYYYSCLPGYSKQHDSVGPFPSVEDARDDARDN